METVAKAGFNKGKIILKNTPISEQPSILAASSSSNGIVFTKPVSIKIPKDEKCAV